MYFAVSISHGVLVFVCLHLCPVSAEEDAEQERKKHAAQVELERQRQKADVAEYRKQKEEKQRQIEEAEALKTKQAAEEIKAHQEVAQERIDYRAQIIQQRAVCLSEITLFHLCSLFDHLTCCSVSLFHYSPFCFSHHSSRLSVNTVQKKH